MPDRDAATRDLREILLRYGSEAEVPPLTPDEAEFVGPLEERLARNFVGDVAGRWLSGFNALLGNRRPIDLLRRGRVRAVVDALDSTEAGSFA